MIRTLVAIILEMARNSGDGLETPDLFPEAFTIKVWSVTHLKRRDLCQRTGGSCDLDGDLELTAV